MGMIEHPIFFVPLVTGDEVQAGAVDAADRVGRGRDLHGAVRGEVGRRSPPCSLREWGGGAALLQRRDGGGDTISTADFPTFIAESPPPSPREDARSHLPIRPAANREETEFLRIQSLSASRPHPPGRTAAGRAGGTGGRARTRRRLRDDAPAGPAGGARDVLARRSVRSRAATAASRVSRSASGRDWSEAQAPMRLSPRPGGEIGVGLGGGHRLDPAAHPHLTAQRLPVEQQGGRRMRRPAPRPWRSPVGIEGEAARIDVLQQHHPRVRHPEASTVDRAMALASFGSVTLASSSQSRNSPMGSVARRRSSRRHWRRARRHSPAHRSRGPDWREWRSGSWEAYSGSRGELEVTPRGGRTRLTRS
jgi:hypothetical protein